MRAHGIVETCGSCPCHCDGCYCDNGNYVRYAGSVMTGAMRKLVYARYYTDWTKRAIAAQIIADRITQVRIHAQGDFFSAEYADAWKWITETVRNAVDYDIDFWTYTKNGDALEILRDTVSIVPSITPCGINFGTCAELLKMHSKLTDSGYRVHICACGTEYEKHCCDCSTGCKAIGRDCDFVLFIKHSTSDYKAGRDDKEDFARVCEIIRNQNN